METCFASPQRSTKEELNQQIEFVTHNPVVDGVMRLAGGLIAVLNHNRQILAVNHRLLEMLGMENPHELLGLRPGEALNCRFSSESETGCGTGPHCVTCGAAIAIVSSLANERPVERTCAISVEKDGRQIDYYFHVCASAIKIDQNKFVLIFLQDITQQQRQAALERIFFHDINNTIMGLLTASELIEGASESEVRAMAKHIFNLSKRLSQEVEFQRHLSRGDINEFKPHNELLNIDDMIKVIQADITLHPSREGKRLRVQNQAPGMLVNSDPALLARVIQNMLINAFEATGPDQVVELKACVQEGKTVFSVWNVEHIPPDIGKRIFMRNFSTKKEFGRGLGTYAMKLIGETLLGGRVYFQSSPDAGTRFSLELPAHGEFS